MKGYYQKEFPSVQILRGWNPQEPTTLATTHPIQTDPATGEPETIASGMVISLNADGTAWTRGVEGTDDAQINSVAIAQDGSDLWDVLDADAQWGTDDDQVAGSLVGLSCTGKFRIATPYFAKFKSTGDAYIYKAGTPITFCKSSETVKTLVPAAGGALAVDVIKDPKGYIRPAEANETVIGIVSETHSGMNREDSGINGNVAISAKALQKSIGKAIDSEAKWYNSYYVVFDTNLSPSNK